MLDTFPSPSAQILTQPTPMPQTKDWPLLVSLPHLL